MIATPARPSRHRSVVASSLLLWTVPALLSTLETVVFAKQGGHPIAVWRAFVSEAPQWYGWALCTPAVLYLANRFPIHGRPRAVNIAIHALACLSASAAIAAADALVGALVRPDRRSFLASAEAWFIGQLPATTVVYFAIVGVSYAWASRARMYEGERRAAELETQLRDAQLAALRMQLQPHFLFNALNAVMALVRDGNATDAVRALSLLGDVLRAATDVRHRHETSLAEELEFVGKYLEIERIRFGDRLGVKIEVPSALGEARLPALILQPFVENALKHGVLRERGSNTITIAAKREDGSLELRVSDDGRGLPASGAPAGVGIDNTRERLERMYGPDASLSIANAATGSGVVVRIRIPWRPSA